MLSITVKTLDSQNHVFSVDDDMTVRQFKEQIAEKTNIAVDSQRLIYCGRVLVDEKLLREYDVNGKVVHLVQRAPPSSRPNHSNRSSNSDSNTNGSGVNVRGAPIFRAIDGMVLGAMAIPVNANNGTPQAAAPSLNPSSTLCMNRITVARYMLECANNIAAYLEDPSRGLNNTAMDILAQQTMESTVLEVGISAVSDVEIPQHQMQNLVQAFQGAVSAAFRQNGISNIRVMQQGNEPNNVQMFASDEQSITGGSGGSTATTSTSAPIAASTAVTSQNPDGTSTQGSSIGATARAPSASSSTSSATRVATENLGPVSTTPNGRQQTTSTQTLAEVVQQMRNVQVRLEPFIQQYYDILLNDPTYDETNSVQRESSQRVYDRVSEALHYMSHAQHAISDLMLDLSTNVPRHLCCRPILVEQSAFVSSGIALPNPVIPLAQVIRPPGLNGNNNETSGNFNNNNQVTGQSTAGGIPPNIGPQQQRQQTGVSGLGQPNFMQQVAIIESDLNNGQSEIVLNLSNRFQQHHNQLDNLGDNVEEEFITTDVTNEDNRGGVGSPPPVQVARLIQAVMNSAPLHADVHVEINNMSSSPQTPTTNNTTDTANNANELTINIHLGDTNPPQQAPQTQPRVTTATHPTTSTQTRSTSRPQVHLTNLQDTPVRNYLRPVPANMLSAFDRFLPCNSHHIRDNLPSEQQQQQGMPIGVTLRNRTSQRPMERITISRPTRTQSDSRLENQRLNNNSGVASSLLNEFSNLGVIYNIPIRIFGDQLLSIRELLNATPTILNGIRQGFLSHIQTTFFNGSTITDENMAGGVNEGLNLLEIYLQPLSQMDLPDYDARRSIENIIRDFLPSIFVLIRDDDSAGFGTRLLRTTNIFFKRLVTILVTCIGHANLLSYCTQVMQTAMSSNILVESQRNLLMSLINRYIDQMTTDLSEVREFIVIRRPAPGENIENLVGAASSNQIQPMDTDDTEEPRPMVVDHEEVVLSVANREQLVQPPTIEDDETLPSVVIGSEPWHVNFPTSSWIPVITRDIGRQRRQNSQAPFSDAYISGMSSKRRKIISDNKPASDVPNMLSEGIRRAIHTAGVSTSSSSPPVDEIATAISTDPIVQTSYKEALKANIQDRLQNDPDFNSERFPSSSKFYNNK